MNCSPNKVARFDETGITNLGSVPAGMSFRDACRSIWAQRKFFINPDHQSRRLTLCETQREIHRIAETLPEPARSDLQMLAACGFDAGKRMDARMKELKGMIP
jgi:hypothetical protein